MIKKITRILIKSGLIFLIVFIAGISAAYAAEFEINVHTPTQDEIALYVQEHPSSLVKYDLSGRPEADYEIGYEADPLREEPYYAGYLSEAELVNALNVIKTIRFIAGISDEIYLSESYNSLAQASAIVNYANGKLSHTPDNPSGMDFDLADEGIKGAKNSNIAWTSWENNTLKWTIIHGWMDDSDKNNLSVLGHRRWILNPSLGMTGFGAVSGEKGTYNAMYIMDKSNPDDSYKGVCWPAVNTPASFFTKETPWSISLGKEVADDEVIVSLIKEGTRERKSQIWTFSKYYSDGLFYVNNQNYGQKGCVIFRPDGIEGYEPGDKFRISVYVGDKTILSYNVTFFDLEKYYSTGAPSAPKLEINDFDEPTITWDALDGADSYNLYRKVRGGSWKLLVGDLDECYFDDATAGRGLRYYYRVTTNKIVNGTVYESDYSASKYIEVPLSKPKITSLKSTAKGTNTIKWSSVSKATGYKVYRRVAGTSTWKLIKTTSEKSYKDTSATRGRKYEYRVRAYRKYNGYYVYSSYSTKKTVTTKK
ncbi:MAG: hypothetical protein IIX87_05300 [Firmicutes bacterium]|nr:hypothetical protein [Bacillota bacterium]